VSGKGPSQLIDAKRVPPDDGERLVLANDLVGRADKRGYLMAASQGEVHDLCAGLAGRAEHEESHRHDHKTGQLGEM
jgi:hypothetical protein